jgi:hypothetical protein
LAPPTAAPILAPVLEVVRERSTDRSALAAARLHRRLTVEEAARRAGLTPDQVEWLEEGRVYRFPSSEHALEATLLLATAYELDHREARSRVGLPVPFRPLGINPAGRLVGVAALSAALMALLAFVFVPVVSDDTAPVDPVVAQAASLPKPWEIHVEVLNGAGDITWTSRSPTRSRTSAAPTASTIRGLPSTTRPAAASSPCGSRASSASSRSRFPAAPTRTGSS